MSLLNVRARKKPKSPRGRFGMTLLEVSAVSVIMTLLSFILLELHQTSSSGLATIRAQAVLRMHLTQALNAISQDAAVAKRDWPSGGTCGVATSELNGRIILLVPQLDANSNPTAAFDDMVCYHLCGVGVPTVPNYCTANGELWRHVNPQPSSSRPVEHRVIARYISTFGYSWNMPNFGDPGRNRVRFSLAAQRTEGGRLYREPQQTDLTAEYSLRNANN